VEAIKKIIEAERQASSQVTEARVYKTMLLNQTKKKAEEQAKKLLADAETIRKQNEQEILKEITNIDNVLADELKEIEVKMNKQVASKKAQLVKHLIAEVKQSDR
jgi:vacuolar-type H+-ATPase subunit H